ncbi:MAG: glycoside hydrolase family 5 protein [Bacilli bacterium]|nr:glycoside hydrolase family 5 protein [Bacilli bacterium]
MNSYKKVLLLIFVIVFIFTLTSCNGDEQDLDTHICLENLSEFKFDQEYKCGETGIQNQICNVCKKVINTQEVVVEHVIRVREVLPECTKDGRLIESCKNCEYSNKTILPATGHIESDLYTLDEIGIDKVGLRYTKCLTCDKQLSKEKFANNGYFAHGKLSVNGADLVDQYGEKVQLYGLSSHGVQWYGHLLTFDTLRAIQSGFGNNIVRFAFYSDERGYCDGTEAKKAQMLEDLYEGIDAATSLGLYVIVDWHMVGAVNEKDKNPLYYLKESKEFFSMISEKYKDQDNILYEIMNEPNGDTTWSDCKKYANAVIPCIRQNSDAIILVGNPHWTADLNSVMSSPLKGYENIMYTYHFYANGHRDWSQVVNAYSMGIPVFISEYGMMLSSGDGPLDTNSGENWLDVLDERNISYVAWNISSSKGSASIFKYGTYEYDNVEDDNLKEWGVYLKRLYRKKSGLDE